MTDVLNTLSRITAPSPPSALRAERHAATTHTQRSYEALFSPSRFGDVSEFERVVVALRVAAVHREPLLIDHYRRLAIKARPDAEGAADVVVVGDIIDAAALAGAGIAAEGASRLAAQFRHADLLAGHPVDARPEHLVALRDARLGVDAIVTLSQLIAFVSFQARVLRGLLLLGGEPAPRTASAGEPRIRTAVARGRFTQEQLAWVPWLEPLPAAEATREQEAALGGPRAHSPYFRLLARDTRVLVERTATDEGIFRSSGGLPRGERELAATVASRVNGCVYCASVHSRLASTYSGRTGDVQRLLDEGVEGEQDERWRALIDFAAALSQTPSRAELGDVALLRRLRFTDLEVLDLVQSTAFFAWANRLMLTLGEPEPAG